MQHYSYRSQESVLRLVDLTDVHRYCYFVAGVVGELLSGLFLIYRPSFRPSSDFQLNGLHFGLFLQKINLLKDQHSDELEKRFLVPDRKALLCSLRKNAQGALNYLLCLPQEESGYRIFCGWSLFLGVASLPWISQAYDAPGEVKNIKIPRSVTQTLLESVQDIAHSNELLKKGFDELLPPFLHEKAPTLKPSPLNSRQSHQSNPEDWFSRLLEGTLGLTEMIQLEMV